MTDTYIFLWRNLGTFFCLLSPLRPELFGSIFPSVCAFAFGASKDDCLVDLRASHLFPDPGSWRKLHESPFETLSICFPLIAFSHFPLNESFSFFLALGCRSSLHNFVLDSEVPRSHRLINFTSFGCLQSGVGWLFVVSNILWSLNDNTV